MADIEKPEKPRKKNYWLGKITNRDEALAVIKEASFGFWTLAGIQAALGFFVAPAVLLDAVLIAVFTGFLFWKQSRIAAVLLLIIAGLSAISTVLNIAGVTRQGGTNIFLAGIFVWVAVRAVEATFKLHGQFKPTHEGHLEP